jgi:hypothetical protein
MADGSTRRLGLTLGLDEYARIMAYARQEGRPVATVAKRVLLEAIDGHDPNAASGALSRERDRVRDLEAEVTRLEAGLAQQVATADLSARLPRMRWPLEALLTDRPWWDEWLPRLGELLGRNLEYDRARGDRQGKAIVDDRGFADLMGYLFPELKDEQGRPTRWHSPDYSRCARRAWDNARAGSYLRQRPVRAEVWEPVVRHVALALSALETTSQDASEAYAHLRVEAEIRGEWMRILGVMLGEGVSQRPPHVPREPLP